MLLDGVRYGSILNMIACFGLNLTSKMKEVSFLAKRLNIVISTVVYTSKLLSFELSFISSSVESLRLVLLLSVV